VEWVYANSSALGGVGANMFNNNKAWSIYAEPAFDLGVATVSVKFDYYTFANVAGAADLSDINIGAALTKNYSDKSRVRLTYQVAALSKKAATDMAHDVRLLWSTSW
jgi:hypothetical protein